MSDQAPKHVRHERATREALGMPGTLPANRCVAFCGERADGQWFFENVDHVVHSLIHGSSVTPCPACLEIIVAIIDKELDK